MYLFGSVLVLAFTVINADFVTDAINCFKSFNIAPAEFYKFMDDPSSVSSNFKCAFRCVAEHVDAIAENGWYDVEKAVAYEIPEFETTVRKCAVASQPTSDPCEVAYQFEKCLLESEPELYRKTAETLIGKA